MTSITKQNFNFLKQLVAHNDRDWFSEHKDEYTLYHEQMISFADDLLGKMKQHDTIETADGKKSLYRIYRDVRFSKDKSPYKSNWSGGFKRATKHLRGGYYFHIEPGDRSFVGGGFWGPNKEDLQRIRENISLNPTELKDIISDPEFVKTFGELKGEQLKTSPKGFDKDDAAVELLRYKQFIISKSFSDHEVLQEDFSDKINDTFKKMRPFLDYMSEILTTDANGTPLF